MKWLRFHYESINPFAMLLILGIFTLYLSFIKNKTKSTYFLIGFLSGNLIYLLYLLLNYWIDIPFSAYLTWFLLNFSATNFIFLSLFATHYYKNIWPLESRIFLYCSFAYFLFIFIPFLCSFYIFPIVYSFDVIPGYNLSITEKFPILYIIFKLVYLLGLFIYIWSFLILVRKAIFIETHHKKENDNATEYSLFPAPDKKIKIFFLKKVVCLFTLKQRQAIACRSFALCILGHMLWFFIYGIYVVNPQVNLPVFLKILLNYFPVLTWLFFITSYMNHSHDSASFTIKLIGFSVILPIVAMSFISNTYLFQHKNNFMQMKISEINSIINDLDAGEKTTSPETLEYIIKKYPGTNNKEIIFNRHGIISPDSFISPGEFIIKPNELADNKISFYYTENAGISAFSYHFKSIISEQDNRLHRYLYFIFSKGHTYYQAGYVFEDYLYYMHTGTRLCVISIFVITIILLLTVTFFIQVIIKKPLSRLLSGVDEVKKGNFSLSVKKIYNDEIGIITDSFNTMIASLKASQCQVREYANDLEKKVEERTTRINEKAHQLKQMNLALQNEISERRKIEMQLEYNALHDPLTGLANRMLLFDHLSFIMNQQDRKDQKLLFSLMFMDIDRFKIINDSLGHEFGDKLLIEIGNRLTQHLRKQDTIARIGGDEFVILMTEMIDMFHVRHCADRILEMVKIPFHYNGKELIVTASIGVTLSSQGYNKPEDMIRDADIAMYRAKSWGRARYAFFDIEMHEKVAKEQELESALHIAAQKNDFKVVFQPIINQQTRKPETFEALIRWKHPELGNIPPCTFIPIAEETGLILSIGDFVLKEAIQTCKKWHSSGYNNINISVNCSAKQFLIPAFHDRVRKILEQNKLQPENLILEITESFFLDNVAEVVQANLLSLKRMGVLLAMDDFGTGYSSLASLNHLPINILKIDRSISLNIPGEISMCKIMNAIISLARYIELSVVVEGIENQEQIDFLSSFTDVSIQGYYYSKPLSEEETFTYLKNH
ncbi:MAG: EAL domain-containing protein [Spirochaetales bacterium]|nr:EAL domain-containing protein [Spirochaetales bacterium]